MTFVPGAVDVAPDGFAAQTRPMLPRRGKGLEELIAAR
jgi:hypothetical protein